MDWKPQIKYVLWIAASLLSGLVTIKLFLYSAILRYDGATAAGMQIRSDGFDMLSVLMGVSTLMIAILPLSRLIKYGWQAAFRRNASRDNPSR